MPAFRPLLACLVALGSPMLPLMAAPASAAVDASDPQRFISTLTTDGFAALRGGDRAAAKAKFRTLLARYFAVDQIGDRLIRRWTPTISADQRAAYKAALPTFLIGTYADRLFEYANADLRVTGASPAGGGVDVASIVTRPGAQPIRAIWSVTKTPDGYKVTNLIVAGVNLAIAQQADFDAVVQRKGFDALVKMMKARG